MKKHLIKAVITGVVCVFGMAGIASAAPNVSVDVNTPNVRVQVGNQPAPPPRQVTVVERERVIVHEREDHHDHHDNGKHRGHDKKHKKNKKHDKHDD